MSNGYLIVFRPKGALFGVVSQGQLDKMFPAKANVEGSDVTVIDYRNGGRTVDNNPCVALTSISQGRNVLILST